MMQTRTKPDELRAVLASKGIGSRSRLHQHVLALIESTESKGWGAPSERQNLAASARGIRQLLSAMPDDEKGSTYQLSVTLIPEVIGGHSSDSDVDAVLANIPPIGLSLETRRRAVSEIVRDPHVCVVLVARKRLRVESELIVSNHLLLQLSYPFRPDLTQKVSAPFSFSWVLRRLPSSQ